MVNFNFSKVGGAKPIGGGGAIAPMPLWQLRPCFNLSGAAGAGKGERSPIPRKICKGLKTAQASASCESRYLKKINYLLIIYLNSIKYFKIFKIFLKLSKFIIKISFFNSFENVHSCSNFILSYHYVLHSTFSQKLLLIICQILTIIFLNFLKINFFLKQLNVS